MQEYCYSSMTDEAIVAAIHDNDEQALDYLMNKYKNLVKNKARTLYLIGGEKDDLIQEGMIGLYKAIRDYCGDKEASFSTFADLCIARQIFSAIKASNTKKNQPLNNYISFEYTQSDLAASDTYASIVQVQDPHKNPEEMLIDRENTHRIESRLNEILSETERQVLYYYLEKENGYGEIANKMKKQPKAIDNALQRIKKKLSRVLKELQV